ncbi:universal stress protein [Rhodococcus chondri]|uniref:Universal stress protein n=1 Tax=Rhodococcus chondri TaxID=3065941 RepID=A0ABU7JUN3_9NOCA|nr:universal stress protein [Rhodococcus sp. CC-R104]MEE2032997.1 universal stress protein [Rhodococcus sp. CC-R104]
MPVAVVHTDTPEGRAALTAGAREATDRQQPLLVLHVLDDASASDVEAVRATVGSVLGDDGWELRTAVHDGDPTGALIDLVAGSGAERLVVGSRGRNAVGKFLLERLLIEAPVPVLVVKTPA